MLNAYRQDTTFLAKPTTTRNSILEQITTTLAKEANFSRRYCYTSTSFFSDGEDVLIVNNNAAALFLCFHTYI